MIANTLIEKAKELFKEEREINYLNGWFLSREIEAHYNTIYHDLPMEERAAAVLVKIAKELPLSISENNIFVGTQRDAFARSYALINPSFQLEGFEGYCDPTAVYGDIEPKGDITQERIDLMREKTRNTEYVQELTKVYSSVERETSEVTFFIEQVTGHLIPDFRLVLEHGTKGIKEMLDFQISKEQNPVKISNYRGMKHSLDAVEVFAQRYQDIAIQQQETANPERKEELQRMIDTLAKVPVQGAETLYEAIQSFILLWQTMCIEQAPNPFAFSVGNADRIFEPYRLKENLSSELTTAYLSHLLVFFNVGDRSWAISQNLIVGGKDIHGNDLSSVTTYALLDAYFIMNLPQPILSLKIHKNTPERMYRELGKFWFTPGVLTPSLFNDDGLFSILETKGFETLDIPDYSVAGCQEPLIMGKDNGNTTNSWLNLPKVLELTLNQGKSLLSGKQLLDTPSRTTKEVLENIRDLFYENVNKQADLMVSAANGATRALSHLRVPFLSSFLGGIESGYDQRDTKHQGTKYNGSGCLIHGLSVIADSFVAIDSLLQDKPEYIQDLLPALQADWKGYEELRNYLKSLPKYGNNIHSVDMEAWNVATRVSEIIASKTNDLGNPYRPDFSSPTTHLLYGYWVGASCDGRSARDMLGYGVDPLYGEAQNGLGFRLLSTFKLPFNSFNGGYASHIGVDPKNFKAKTLEDKGIEFRDKIINTIFFNPKNNNTSPFYVYFNITTADILRKVLAEPNVYAPSGIYIMRIHGTFVNFLDLSPQIQQDIIIRLDANSTSLL